jgi:hypothetical protein
VVEDLEMISIAGELNNNNNRNYELDNKETPIGNSRNQSL